LSVLTEIKNRGTNDVCMVVCDGLKGLPKAINTVWVVRSSSRRQAPPSIFSTGVGGNGTSGADGGPGVGGGNGGNGTRRTLV
jgi:hypothetical protein